MKTNLTQWQSTEVDEDGKVIETTLHTTYKIGSVTVYESETIFPETKKKKRGI